MAREKRGLLEIEKIEYYNKLVKDKMNLNDAVLKSNYFENK